MKIPLTVTVLYLTLFSTILVINSCQRENTEATSTTITESVTETQSTQLDLLNIFSSTSTSSTSTSIAIQALIDPNNNDTVIPFLRQFAREQMISKPIIASDRIKGPLVDLSLTKGLSHTALSSIIKDFCKDYAQGNLKPPKYLTRLSLQLPRPDTLTKNFLLTFSTIRFLTIIRVDEYELALAVYLSGINEAKYLDLYLTKDEKGTYNVSDAYFRDQGTIPQWTDDGIPDSSSRDLQERMRKKAWQ